MNSHSLPPGQASRARPRSCQLPLSSKQYHHRRILSLILSVTDMCEEWGTRQPITLSPFCNARKCQALAITPLVSIMQVLPPMVPASNRSPKESAGMSYRKGGHYDHP